MFIEQKDLILIIEIIYNKKELIIKAIITIKDSIIKITAKITIRIKQRIINNKLITLIAAFNTKTEIHYPVIIAQTKDIFTDFPTQLIDISAPRATTISKINLIIDIETKIPFIEIVIEIKGNILVKIGSNV